MPPWKSGWPRLGLKSGVSNTELLPGPAHVFSVSIFTQMKLGKTLGRHSVATLPRPDQGFRMQVGKGPPSFSLQSPRPTESMGDSLVLPPPTEDLGHHHPSLGLGFPVLTVPNTQRSRQGTLPFFQTGSSQPPNLHSCHSHCLEGLFRNLST